jgi:hypothetical protein
VISRRRPGLVLEWQQEVGTLLASGGGMEVKFTYLSFVLLKVVSFLFCPPLVSPTLSVMRHYYRNAIENNISKRIRRLQVVKVWDVASELCVSNQPLLRSDAGETNFPTYVTALSSWDKGRCFHAGAYTRSKHTWVFKRGIPHADAHIKHAHTHTQCHLQGAATASCAHLTYVCG